MLFLAHRGLWRQREEGNTLAALDSAQKRGYGIEFDVRDSNGELVIAHDIVDSEKPTAAELLEAFGSGLNTVTLALNIKSDGLSSRIETLVTRHGLNNYFCFDMSVPETLNYRRLGLRYFTRHSEHEPSPVLYADAAGVWMDMFESDWITAADIRAHLDRGKQVAIVSPELHRRPHAAFWERLRADGIAHNPQVMLCTDHPDEARSFFDA